MNFTYHAIALAIATTIASASASAGTLDTFDPSTNMLTLQSVKVGGSTFYNANVKINSYSQLNVAGGAPVATSFNGDNSMLTMGSVSVGGQTFNNVQARIDSYQVVAVGNAFDQQSMRIQAMQRISEVLQQCQSLTKITEAEQLQNAASSHMKYMTANKQFTVTEVAGSPYYTALSVNSQIAANGYGFIALPQFSPIPLGATGGQWVDSVLSTTLGAARLLQAQEMGLSFAQYPETNPTTMLGYGFFGKLTTTMNHPSGRWSSYPCNGMTGVSPRNSTGNAMANWADVAYTVTGLNAEVTGTPITLVGTLTVRIIISSATLTDAAGTEVPIQWFDGANSGLNTGYAVIVPSQPLKEYTKYTLNAMARWIGTGAQVADKPFSTSFTTGATTVYP